MMKVKFPEFKKAKNTDLDLGNSLSKPFSGSFSM